MTSSSKNKEKNKQKKIIHLPRVANQAPQHTPGTLPVQGRLSQSAIDIIAELSEFSHAELMQEFVRTSQELEESTALNTLYANKIKEYSQLLQTYSYFSALLPIRNAELRRLKEKINKLDTVSESLTNERATRLFLQKQLDLVTNRLNDERAKSQQLQSRLHTLQRESEERIQALSQELATLNATMKSMASEKQSLLMKQQSMRADFSNEIERLNCDIESLSKKIDNEQALQTILRNKLQQQQNLSKQLSEKMHDMRQQLNEQSVDMVSLTEKIDSQRKTMHQVRTLTESLEMHSFEEREPRSLILPSDKDTGDISPILHGEVSIASSEYAFSEAVTVDEDSERIGFPVSPSSASSLPPRPFHWMSIYAKGILLFLLFLLTTITTGNVYNNLQPYEPPYFNMLSALSPPPETMGNGIPARIAYPTFHLQSKKTLKNLSKETVIVLDAGHGGDDPGATQGLLWKEKDFTLDLVKRVQNKLNETGFHTVLTRKYDTFVSIEERTAIANSFPNSLFVSIHLNTHPLHSTKEARGFAVFYNDDISRHVAELIFQKTIELPYIQTYNDGIIDGRRFYGNDPNRLVVLNTLHNPGVLIETCFISHERDFKQIIMSGFRERLAHQLAEGIMNACEHEK